VDALRGHSAEGAKVSRERISLRVEQRAVEVNGEKPVPHCPESIQAMFSIPIEVVAVVIGLAIPAAAAAVRWICRSGTLARDQQRSKADHAEVAKIHDCLDNHARGINWIGDAVEKLAQHQRVALPPRAIVPERERE